MENGHAQAAIGFFLQGFAELQRDFWLRPDNIEADIAAIRQYGTGCTGSRFLNGPLDQRLERVARLASYMRKEAVVMSSLSLINLRRSRR